MKWFLYILASTIFSLCLLGCQAVQEQTNKEAPHKALQKEGREEIKKSAGERNKKETKKQSEEE